jgi:hypothetical protein
MSTTRLSRIMAGHPFSSGVILYSCVGAGEDRQHEEFLQEKQEQRLSTEARTYGVVVVGCYRDVSDGFKAGPELIRLLDDIDSGKWEGPRQPVVLVDRLWRISRDIEVVRDIFLQLHHLESELLSLREPDAFLSSNLRWPVSLGELGPLGDLDAVAAAVAFGSATAAQFRVDAPARFEKFCREGGLLRPDDPFPQLDREIAKLPSPEAGLKLLNYLCGDVAQSDLERGFLAGFDRELQLHLGVRGAP